MNWSLQASNLWGESEVAESRPLQALNSLVEGVNLLVDQLRIPNDPANLRTDLTKTQTERVWKLLGDGVRNIQAICGEYSVRPELNVPEVESDEEENEPGVSADCIEVGTRFDSLESATLAFERYASMCGFTVCKGNSKRDVYQELACSARGKVRIRKSAEGRKRNRGSIKRMCKCHIILRKVDDSWTVTTRNLRHTHSLLDPEDMRKVAKLRHIPESVKEKALKLYELGEKPAKIQYMFEKEMKEECTWTMKDLYNMLYRHRRETKQD